MIKKAPKHSFCNHYSFHSMANVFHPVAPLRAVGTFRLVSREYSIRRRHIACKLRYLYFNADKILRVTLKNPGQFLNDELEFWLHFLYRGATGMARCDFQLCSLAKTPPFSVLEYESETAIPALKKCANACGFPKRASKKCLWQTVFGIFEETSSFISLNGLVTH